MTAYAPITPVATARPTVGPWQAMWILVGTIAFLILFRDLMFTRWHGDRSIADVCQWGRDFANVWTSGSLTLKGRLDILYDVEAYRAYQLELFESGMKYHNYSYPPVTLLYAWFFALLPYPVALLAWLGGTGALFAAAARPYMKNAGLPLWMAVAAPASLINLWAGHYGFLIGALWLAGWHHLPRRPVLAGMLIGLMVVKPHLAVLAPFVLLRRREWKAIAAAAATVILLVGVSAAVFGTDLWVTYLTETTRLQAAMVDDTDSFFITMMPTVLPSLALLGVSVAAGTVVQIVVGLTALSLLLWKLPRDSREAGLATAAATFLVLPYAFSYDMTAAGLGALLLFRRALDDEAGAGYSFAALGAALVPMIILYTNFFGYPVSPPLIAFQLGAALRLWPGQTKPA
ncbi:MAG TPA: glycosyltransferase family 87 protein [Allosphingosinicella sp.]|nr:glycosyltransferase family 87 protein [Allosphingosinicella sp.]